MTFDDAALKSCISDSNAIKDTTKRAYLADLNTISKYVGKVSLMVVLENPDKYVPIITAMAYENRKVIRKDAIGTTRTLFKTILAVLKILFSKWYKYFIAISKKVSDASDNNVQTESSMTWEDVTSAYNHVKTTGYASLQHITLALYTLIPPRRQNDYWKLALSTTPIVGSTGYIDLSCPEPFICVSVYKTAAKYDEWRKTLPTELIDILRDHVANKPRDFLFCKQDGKPYASLYSFTLLIIKLSKQF
jgi:hypothetical protein